MVKVWCAMTMELKNLNLPATRLIGPEDIAPGQFVAIAEQTAQFAPPELQREGRSVLQPQTMTTYPQNAGVPYEVVTVALPFVMVKDYEREPFVFDLRQLRLAVVPDEFARKYFEARRLFANK